MSLYDDLDVKTKATEKIQGWSSGIKLLQSQLQLKKATVTQPKREQQRKASLPPVIDLKSKRDEEDIFSSTQKTVIPAKVAKVEPTWPILSNAGTYGSEYDWNVIDEYDPLWPNEYEKVVRELRDNRDRDDKDKRRNDRRRKSRFSSPEETSPPPSSSLTPQMTQPPIGSGFAGRWEDDDDLEPIAKPSRSTGGVAIAPPPSLQEPEAPKAPQPSTSSYGGGASSVAAKIMAKYGFKEGQGLGKQEQGMSSALLVEKTSKRGGRIIHEKEIMPPPPPQQNTPTEQPSITDMMKNPSKIVLLRNMVGPGEVDDDLEPEVKDECNTKYGPVCTVHIREIENCDDPEEAVRIFVEFQRMESAVKAVVDLNGRFFGGRQVKAGDRKSVV